MTCHAQTDRGPAPAPTLRIRGVEASRPDFDPTASPAVKVALSIFAGAASALVGLYIGMSSTSAGSVWWWWITGAAVVAACVVVGHRCYQRGLNDGWQRRGEHDLRRVDQMRGGRIDIHA